MEIAMLSKDMFKIRSKHSLILVNPTGKEIECQGIISLGEKDPSSLAIPQAQSVPVVDGPGEYEIGGIKITGFQDGNYTIYSMNIDNIDMLLATTTGLAKMHTKLQDHQVVVLRSDGPLDMSAVSALSPKALLVYGNDSQDIVKTLSQEDVKKMNKYVTTVDKLPQEFEIVLLSSS